MQRKKPLLAATIISMALLTGSVAYAATSLLDSRDDNVGNLETTAIQPADVGANPAPDSVAPTTSPTVTAARPAATTSSAAVTAPASPAVTTRPTDDKGHDDDDDIFDDHGGDRRHGRDGDDD